MHDENNFRVRSRSFGPRTLDQGKWTKVLNRSLFSTLDEGGEIRGRDDVVKVHQGSTRFVVEQVGIKTSPLVLELGPLNTSLHKQRDTPKETSPESYESRNDKTVASITNPEMVAFGSLNMVRMEGPLAIILSLWHTFLFPPSSCLS